MILYAATASEFPVLWCGIHTIDVARGNLLYFESCVISGSRKGDRRSEAPSQTQNSEKLQRMHVHMRTTRQFRRSG